VRIDPSAFNDLTGQILALTGCPVGLLINFNVRRLMDGVRRMINPRAGSSLADKVKTEA